MTHWWAGGAVPPPPPPPPRPVSQPLLGALPTGPHPKPLGTEQQTDDLVAWLAENLKPPSDTPFLATEHVSPFWVGPEPQGDASGTPDGVRNGWQAPLIPDEDVDKLVSWLASCMADGPNRPSDARFRMGHDAFDLGAYMGGSALGKPHYEIVGIDVTYRIIPPKESCAVPTPLKAFIVPEDGAHRFQWNPRTKTGYVRLVNRGQTVDGRLGPGYVVGAQGFVAGQVEWRFEFEAAEGRCRVGFAAQDLAAFPLQAWGFSRYRFRQKGEQYVWLSHFIEAAADAGSTAIRLVVDFPDCSATVLVNDVPFFRAVDFPPGLPLFPAIECDGAVITAMYPSGVVPHHSLYVPPSRQPVGTAQRPEDEEVVVPVPGRTTFRHRFRAQRQQKARETLQGMRRGLDGDLLATGTGVTVF